MNYELAFSYQCCDVFVDWLFISPAKHWSVDFSFYATASLVILFLSIIFSLFLIEPDSCVAGYCLLANLWWLLRCCL